MIPHTSWNGADHAPFPGASRGPALDVTARHSDSAGQAKQVPNAARHARTRHSSPAGTILQYSPATNSWNVLASLPSGRAGARAILAGNGSIYAIGGVLVDSGGSAPLVLDAPG
jgi:N-acetylneuraminic acid mutarotase